MRPETQQQKRSGLKTESASPASFKADFKVNIKPSIHFTALLLALHAFSMLALWQTPYLPGTLLLPLVVLVLISAVLALYRSAEHTTLAWLADEQLLLSVDRRSAHRLGNPPPIRTTLSPRSLHCSLFILLEMRDSGGHYCHCLIPRDAVSDAGFRKLRSRLYLHERVPD